MYIDLHCDTIIKYVKESNPEELMNGETSDVNLKELIKNKVKSQFMAIYLYDDDYEDNPNIGRITDWDYIKKCVDFLNKTEEKYKDNITIVTNYEEYVKSKNSKKLSLFKTIEDGRCIEEIEDLEKLKELGISLITLLWNNPNKIGYPHSKDVKLNERGLTNFGIKIVEGMNNQKLIIDVSHLSDGGFWDICKYSSSPFMATHSNSRTIENHSRNLNDEQVKALSSMGGIMGLNVFPPFVNGNNTAKFHDYLNHIKYILQIGGENVLGIGTDFDGINGEYEIDSPKKVVEFMNYLNLNGINSKIVEKIAYGNVENFFKDFYRG